MGSEWTGNPCVNCKHDVTEHDYLERCDKCTCGWNGEMDDYGLDNY